MCGRTAFQCKTVDKSCLYVGGLQSETSGGREINFVRRSNRFNANDECECFADQIAFLNCDITEPNHNPHRQPVITLPCLRQPERLLHGYCRSGSSSNAWEFQPVAITGCFDYLSPQIGCVTRHKFAMLNKERL